MEAQQVLRSSRRRPNSGPSRHRRPHTGMSLRPSMLKARERETSKTHYSASGILEMPKSAQRDAYRIQARNNQQWILRRSATAGRARSRPHNASAHDTYGAIHRGREDIQDHRFRRPRPASPNMYYARTQLASASSASSVHASGGGEVLASSPRKGASAAHEMSSYGSGSVNSVGYVLMDSSFQIREGWKIVGRAISRVQKSAHAEVAPLHEATERAGSLDLPAKKATLGIGDRSVINIRLASRSLVTRVILHSVPALTFEEVELACANEMGDAMPVKFTKGTPFSGGGVLFSSTVMGATSRLKVRCARRSQPDPNNSVNIEAPDNSSPKSTSKAQTKSESRANARPDIDVEQNMNETNTGNILQSGLSENLKQSLFEDGNSNAQYVRVIVEGFSINDKPHSDAVIPLINMSAKLRGEGRMAESVDADMLCGLALLSTRRFLQANETFRRAESSLFEELDDVSAAKLDQNGSVPSSDYTELRAIRASRAMTFSILAADGLSHVNQLYDKLVAYHRTTEYYLLEKSLRNKSSAEQSNNKLLKPCAEIHPATDVSTGLASLQPHLTESLLATMQHPMRAVRAAAARSMQYVLDHVSCSVGSMFPRIFQKLVHIYPIDVQEEENLYIDEKHVVLLLETCYNMLPCLSRPELQQTVIGSVEPYLRDTDALHNDGDIDMPSLRLLLQLLRVLLLVTSRLRGDMPLSPESVIALLRFGMHKAPVVRRSARICWEAIAKQVPRWPVDRQGPLGRVFDWCNQQICAAEEGDGTPNETVLFLVGVTTDLASELSASHLAQNEFATPLLNLIPVIVGLIRKHCFSPDSFRANSSSVSTPRESVHEQSDMLEFFGCMWRCIQALKAAIPEHQAPPSNALALPLLRLAYTQCCIRSPSAATLGVLRCLLHDGVVKPHTPLPDIKHDLDPTPRRESSGKAMLTFDGANSSLSLSQNASMTMGDFLVGLLGAMVQWVPHSVNDDTFHCLSMLLHLTRGMLTPEGASSVLNALLDRYTVRSSAHMEVLQCFVRVLLLNSDATRDGASPIFEVNNGEEQPSITKNAYVAIPELLRDQEIRLATEGSDAKNFVGATHTEVDSAATNTSSATAYEQHAQCLSRIFDDCLQTISGQQGAKPHAKDIQQHTDSLRERLSFLFLCLSTLDDADASKRLPICDESLWQNLTKIVAACRSMLLHPNGSIRRLAFHIPVLLMRVLHASRIDQSDRVNLFHNVFTFLEAGLQKKGHACGPLDAEIQLRCIQLMHIFFNSIMPPKPENTADGNVPLTLPGGVDPYKKLGYEERRFVYMVCLWKRVVKVVHTPWKNLRSVALWILSELVGVSRGRCFLPAKTKIESSNNNVSFVTTHVQEFEKIVVNAVLMLINDSDWECRLAALKIVRALAHPSHTLKVDDTGSILPVELVSDLKPTLKTLCSEWNKDVAMLAQEICTNLLGIPEVSQLEKASPPKKSIRMNMTSASVGRDDTLSVRAAPLQDLWEDKETSLAELESLEDFVRGTVGEVGEDTSNANHLSINLQQHHASEVPIRQIGLIKAAYRVPIDHDKPQGNLKDVAVQEYRDSYTSIGLHMPAPPPERAFLDSFLGETDSQLLGEGEGEDDETFADLGVIDIDDDTDAEDLSFDDRAGVNRANTQTDRYGRLLQARRPNIVVDIGASTDVVLSPRHINDAQRTGGSSLDRTRQPLFEPEYRNVRDNLHNTSDSDLGIIEDDSSEDWEVVNRAALHHRLKSAFPDEDQNVYSSLNMAHPEDVSDDEIAGPLDTASSSNSGTCSSSSEDDARSLGSEPHIGQSGDIEEDFEDDDERRDHDETYSEDGWPQAHDYDLHDDAAEWVHNKYRRQRRRRDQEHDIVLSDDDGDEIDDDINTEIHDEEDIGEEDDDEGDDELELSSQSLDLDLVDREDDDADETYDDDASDDDEDEDEDDDASDEDDDDPDEQNDIESGDLARTDLSDSLGSRSSKRPLSAPTRASRSSRASSNSSFRNLEDARLTVDVSEEEEEDEEDVSEEEEEDEEEGGGGEGGEEGEEGEEGGGGGEGEGEVEGEESGNTTLESERVGQNRVGSNVSQLGAEPSVLDSGNELEQQLGIIDLSTASESDDLEDIEHQIMNAPNFISPSLNSSHSNRPVASSRMQRKLRSNSGRMKSAEGQSLSNSEGLDTIAALMEQADSEMSGLL